MYTARVFRNISIITVILLSYSMLSAQIKIKERVEINPTESSISNGSRINKYYSTEMPGPLNPNDFAINGGGGFIEYFDDIYEDIIFVPRIGGVIGIAYDYWYLLRSGIPYYNRLYVFEPSGNIKQVFNFSEFMDGDGNWNTYEFSQEKYEQDRENAYYWAERDSSHFLTDSTKWGYYPKTRMFLPVKMWEPLRFRYYHYEDPDEGIFETPSHNPLQGLFTDYPNWNKSTGRMVFADFSEVGELFLMKWITRDSGAIGTPPIVYSDPQPEFYLPDDGMYRVIIGNTLPHVTGTLSVIDTASHILVTDVRSHQGDTILIGPYTEGTILKFDLDGMKQSGGQGEYASGGINFESWTDYDFQDAAIWFEYAAQPVDHLELWSTTSTIYYGDTVDIEIVPCGADSLFSPLGADYNYEFSIELTGETSRYVELIYEDESSDHFDHVYSYNRRGADIRLAANKEEPDSVVNLTFHLKAKYIGQGGVATSMGRIPVEASRTGILMKQNVDNSKNTVDYKDGKITIDIGAQKKTYEKIGIKRLQSLYSAKTRRIGRPVISEERKTTPAVSLSKKRILASMMEGESENVWLENDWGWNISQPIDIMLGETIYFQAIPDYNRDGNLYLKPWSNLGNISAQQCNSALFWALKKENESKLGIYWEYRDKKGTTLRPDIVRVIGRFWNNEDDEPFLVTLNATSGNRIGKIQLKIIKPKKLGYKNNTSHDIADNPINIDDLCITLAGKIGIPPQILKGHIEKESPIGNYGFAPPYRFEPFTNGLTISNNVGKWGGNPYWITETSMGTGGDVPPHKNLLYMSYYHSLPPPSIWDIINDYSQLETTSPAGNWTIFAKRLSDGKIDFARYYYKTIQAKYDEYLNYWLNDADDEYLDINEKINLARLCIIGYLKMDEGLGLDNIIAQTRIGSSYGLTQLMYETATKLGYEQITGNLPENLNVNSIYYSLVEKHYVNKLKAVIGNDYDSKTNNWKNGYENILKKVIQLWNPNASGYSNNVFVFVPDYEPIKSE